jgi:mono/diheme cytochrome c family protein
MRLRCSILITALVLCAGLAKAADLSDAETKAARKIYLVKCAKCHKFYDPADYSDSEWTSWMAKMTKKSRLKKDQAELLSRYLETIHAARKAD